MEGRGYSRNDSVLISAVTRNARDSATARRKKRRRAAMTAAAVRSVGAAAEDEAEMKGSVSWEAE
jgi:hypothetical protein